MKVKKSYLIFIIIVATSLFVIGINARLSLKEIEKSGILIVSKFTNIERFPKSRDYFFEFYYNNLKKRCRVGKVPEGFYNNVGKFYRIKYLEEYPDLIVVEFNQEVTDTTEILRAGFSKEDL
jgi:hypothetical protein